MNIEPHPGNKYNCLTSQVLYSGMLPTPQTTDYNTATHPDTYKARKERHAAKGVNLQFQLRDMARQGLLPTPTASAIGENQTSNEIHISKDG
ncbi:MAG: hypothetical protein ACKOPP_02800, partial [Bacteroidota bacterium]